MLVGMLMNALQGLVADQAQSLMQTHVLDKINEHLDDDAKKEFRIAARDKDKKVKTTANNWIKYTENEEIRVKNLALRRDYIQSQS